MNVHLQREKRIRTMNINSLKSFQDDDADADSAFPALLLSMNFANPLYSCIAS